MVSLGASSSSQLRTHLAPGTAPNGFNITLVAYVSDNLGATAVTSLGVDGVPLAFESTFPDQVGLPFLALPLKTISSDRVRANRPFVYDNRLIQDNPKTGDVPPSLSNVPQYRHAPLQVSVALLRSNISSFSAGGDSSFLDPADALRNAAAVSSVLEYVPQPESAEELMEVIELKV